MECDILDTTEGGLVRGDGPEEVGLISSCAVSATAMDEDDLLCRGVLFFTFALDFSGPSTLSSFCIRLGEVSVLRCGIVG